MKKVRQIEKCGKGKFQRKIKNNMKIQTKNEWTRKEREKNKNELEKVFGMWVVKLLYAIMI